MCSTVIILVAKATRTRVSLCQRVQGLFSRNGEVENVIVLKTELPLEFLLGGSSVCSGEPLNKCWRGGGGTPPRIWQQVRWVWGRHYPRRHREREKGAEPVQWRKDLGSRRSLFPGSLRTYSRGPKPPGLSGSWFAGGGVERGNNRGRP